MKGIYIDNIFRPFSVQIFDLYAAISHKICHMKFGITVAFQTWTITYSCRVIYTRILLPNIHENIHCHWKKIVIYKSQIRKFIEFWLAVGGSNCNWLVLQVLPWLCHCFLGEGGGCSMVEQFSGETYRRGKILFSKKGNGRGMLSQEAHFRGKLSIIFW